MNDVAQDTGLAQADILARAGSHIERVGFPLSNSIALKYLITRIGRFLSPGAVQQLGAGVNYLEAGRWMRAHNYDVSRRLQNREELFDLVGNQVSDRDVLYMEFGVFCGDAMRYWSKLLQNPNSKLHGFDTFEGLPESWADTSYPPGYFSTGGKLPQIDDPRVQFFKGLFEETLPHYQLPPHEVLILMLDADLYSSTAYVLNTLTDAIVPGTYIYFDEFHHRFDEMRAFNEFLQRTGWEFSLVGTSRLLDNVIFQRTR